VCYSALQCVAACCSALQCVAVCCSAVQRVAVCIDVNAKRRSGRCIRMRQDTQIPLDVTAQTFVCCSVLQCAAVDNITELQCVRWLLFLLQCVAVFCSVLRCVAVCCGVVQYAALRCSVLQCVVAGCCVLQCVDVEGQTVNPTILTRSTSLNRDTQRQAKDTQTETHRDRRQKHAETHRDT